ncbi:MAG TPA: hypothetical protein VMH41_02260 [Mycobacteriales bacterium]|nr:hypothetical protein [Mycobacteriales bacterium]
MKKTAAVIGAAGICLTAGLAPALAAGSVHHFHTTASPKTVKVGHNVTAKGTGAEKNTTYYCALTLYKKGVNIGQAGADLTSATQVKSNKKGAISCTRKVVSWHGSGKYSSYKCPVPKAQAKKGWHCAIAFADAATQGGKSVGIATFNAKK